MLVLKMVLLCVNFFMLLKVLGSFERFFTDLAREISEIPMKL